MRIVARNLELTKPIHHYVEEKVSKVESFIPNVIEVNIYLEVEKLQHRVHVMLKFSHFFVNVSAETENMYAAIDKVFDRLYKKLRKWKGRIQDHHAKGHAMTEMEVSVLEQEEDLEQEIIDANNESLEPPPALPKVVKKKKRPLKLLTLDEAVMKMELSNDHFMIYKSEESQTLKVIYRRRDGSYGVISPE